MVNNAEKIFETSYPFFLKDIMTVCVGVYLCLILLIEAVYGIKDNKAVCIFLIILCLLTLIVRIGIGRYNIVIDKKNVIVTPFIGRKKIIELSDIDELKESKSGGISIICKGKKVVTIDRATEKYEQLCELLERKLKNQQI